MKSDNARAINELVCAIACTLDAMNEEAGFCHSRRTAILASEFAKNILPRERKNIFYAACLHNVGYLAFPESMRHYLSSEDDTRKDPALLSHPLIGAEIACQIPNLSSVAKYILHHHEWYNGGGYPFEKKQNQIPKGAQIILLADQIDLILSSKPARNIESIEKTVLAWSNERLSSEIAEAAYSILKESGFLKEVADCDAIAGLFSKVRRETGWVQMPSNINAIGITCETLSLLVDIKHPSIIGHSKRVSSYSLLIALAMNLPHEEIIKIKLVALLHDIGKLEISKGLINKPARLASNEYEKMKKHSLFSRSIIEMITDFKDIAVDASSDHERYDGTGYPSGLKGEDIPLLARVISVADTFDAMISNRPYRKAMTNRRACEEIVKNSGTQFDPKVVKEAIPVLQNLTFIP